MNNEVIQVLKDKACASIRYRVRKEILEENPYIEEYLDEILNDKRVKYVFTWQRPDGFLGQSFHGGWIPDAKLKLYNTGAEAALRFLAEMGVPKNYPVVEKGLNALLKYDWNPDPWKWGKIYEPGIGLFGGDILRAVVFSYFSMEEYAFIQTELKRVLEVINRLTEISSIEGITGTYRNKLYFNGGISLPDLYHLRLLAFTKDWQNSNHTSKLTKAIEHLIELSPLPHIYIKCQNQLITPAEIYTQNFKKRLSDFQPLDWYWWLHTTALFARMGLVKQIPTLLGQVNELKEVLQEGDGFFPFRPSTSVFEKWNVYVGLALEDSWANSRWKYDLTFRSLLILKYAGMI